MKVINEYYHIYNRGAHKAPIFNDVGDFRRFIALLYRANDEKMFREKWDADNLWRKIKETDPLVEIFAYCLMPNHYHLGCKEIKENGIKRFVHRLCTSYSMYYNNKYDHSGTIFQGIYKSKHIDNDDYLRYLLQYIHLNPFGIEEPDMTKATKQEHLEEAIEYAKNYEYSSYKDYLGEDRPQKIILRRLHLAGATCANRTKPPP